MAGLTTRHGIKLSRQLRQFSSAVSEKTALYDLHITKQGKVVDFAGYQLPVQYADMSIVASHLHTRKNASIFDVSHMLQTYIRGKDCIECFETLCPADIRRLPVNSGTLTIFTTGQGCIYDDLIVTKISDDCLYVVSNAAMRKQDMDIMENAIRRFKSNGKDVSAEFYSIRDRSLVAIQGPKAVSLLQKVVPVKYDLSKLYFMSTTAAEVVGVSGCRITRCGYTGEDGVEISIPSDRVQSVVEGILAAGGESMKLAGLGARDSLRLEAGLCLYGTDIDQTTTPVEANLSWLIAKRRRAEDNFPGSHIINKQLNGTLPVEKRRVGFTMQSGGPAARHGTEIYVDNEKVGEVTSGCPGPSLGTNIGMGYVADKWKKAGTPVQLKIRNRFYLASIEKMPFVKTNYYLKAK